MLGFFLILGAIVLGNLFWWLWADRRLRPVPMASAWRALLATFVLAQFAYLAAFFLRPGWARQSHFFIPAELLSVFYLWSLIILPATVLVTLLLVMGNAAMRWWPRSRPARHAAPPPVDTDEPTPPLSRRQLLGAMAVAVPPLVTGVGVAYGRHALYDLHINRIDVPIANLPRALDGLKIAHLTDVHVGKFVSRPYLREVAAKTNALDADLHLLTGDLIDLSLRDLPDALDFVESLQPRHAKVMCEGNHDLIDDPRSFYDQTLRRGISILRQAERTIEIPGRAPVQLIGERWGGHNTAAPGARGYDQAVDHLLDLKERRPDAFSILLAHHPHAFDPAIGAGIDLTLAGHTHGGLLMLSERAGPASFMYRYFRGLYHRGASSLYVSSGVGSWFPLRLKARPEVALLTLRSV